MQTTIRRTGKKVEVTLTGRVDTIASPQFEQSLGELMEEEGLDVLIDCSGMDYISSSGLRVFLTLRKALEAHGGQLVLLSMQEGIREIFDMTGFSKLFTIN
ncbi:MAG: STAS domain-containing protein [Candidatus Cryptobacteroides sp.]